MELLDKALAMAIKDISLYPRMVKYKDIFKNEDYLIFYYLGKVSDNNTSLTKEVLYTYLIANAQHWLMRNSIIKQSDQNNLTKEYLSSKSVTPIISKRDEEDILVEITVDRFEELSNYVIPKEEYNSIIDALESFYKIDLGDRLITDITNLSRNPIREQGVTYTKSEMIEYVKHRINIYEQNEVNIGTNTHYQSMVDEHFIRSLEDREQCFEWNIGSVNLPKIYKGNLLSIIGMSKVGKTSFVIGEIVYPTLMLGNNVGILSGEMSLADIISFLTVKHLYVKTGVRLQTRTCSKVIGIVKKLNSMELDLSQAKDILIMENVEHKDYYELLKYKNTIINTASLKPEILELILSSYNDLLDPKSNIGVPILLTKDDGVFNIDNLELGIKDMVANHNVKMVVIDHMALIEGNTNRATTEILTDAYRTAKKIAQNKENPIVVVAINHLDTSSEENISKGKVDNLSAVRAFNTNESGKSADVEIILHRTPESIKEGQIFATVKYARYDNIPPGSIALISDYLVYDFCTVGTQKKEYKTSLL